MGQELCVDVPCPSDVTSANTADGQSIAQWDECLRIGSLCHEISIGFCHLLRFPCDVCQPFRASRRARHHGGRGAGSWWRPGCCSTWRPSWRPSWGPSGASGCKAGAAPSRRGGTCAPGASRSALVLGACGGRRGDWKHHCGFGGWSRAQGTLLDLVLVLDRRQQNPRLLELLRTANTISRCQP
jgi:hypothetical protein